MTAAAPTASPAPEFSEDYLALDFVRRAAKFRWSPGPGWRIDDGVTWQRDEKMSRYTLARHVVRDAAARASTDKEARGLASARVVNAVLSLAQTDRRIVVSNDEWDADPLLLNTPGGVVNLRTGALRARGNEYLTQVARIAPAAASCPVWLRFLDQVFMGDQALIEFMRRAMGYFLTGLTHEQVLFFLYGDGANGKSVLIDLLQWLCGSYSIKLPASTLMQSKGERHPTELAQLFSKRLAVSSEVDEGSFFNESLIKELTGDKTLRARYMRADFFEFTMQQKHVIVGNFKPRLRGGDPAIARRMLLVPFLASFKGAARDPHMLDKLKAEGPAILHWMIQGAIVWASEGLGIPEAVRAASADYMADHDDLALWMDECCVRQGEARAGDLYASFANWKKSRGEHAPSLTVWGSRLVAVAGITKQRSNGIRYAGIQLTTLEAMAVQELRR